MFASGNLPPLFHNHHRCWDSTAISGTPVPMVRNSPEDHIPLRTRTNQGSRGQLKPVNGIPSPNRQPIRTSKPVGRTVSTSHHGKPNRVEQMATNGNRGPQQQQELHHGLRPERTTNRLGTPVIVRTALGIKESNRRRIPIEHATK
jgi:hypothetical protein